MFMSGLGVVCVVGVTIFMIVKKVFFLFVIWIKVALLVAWVHVFGIGCSIGAQFITYLGDAYGINDVGLGV